MRVVTTSDVESLHGKTHRTIFDTIKDFEDGVCVVSRAAIDLEKIEDSERIC